MCSDVLLLLGDVLRKEKCWRSFVYLTKTEKRHLFDLATRVRNMFPFVFNKVEKKAFHVSPRYAQKQAPVNNVGHTFPFINISTWRHDDVSEVTKKSAFGTKFLKNRTFVCQPQSISVTGKVQLDRIVQKAEI